MFEALKGVVLRFARVPSEPHPPFGSPGSIRMFRAAPNYWKYVLVRWGIKQILGAAGIVFFLSWTGVWRAAAHAQPPAPPPVAAQPAPTPVEEPGSTRAGRRRIKKRFDVASQRLLPDTLHTLELIGLGFFVVQVPFSLAAARLDYEMRWYMVTDRSMRLREGIFAVREMTLTFANVQNITIRQGPLQRFLGISDVVVRTAGGGGSTDAHGHDAGGLGETMHTGTLRAVESAEQVRDLILDRLRRLRDAGLGDPDDRHHEAAGSSIVFAGDAETLRAAARELLEETRALRSALH